MPRRPHAARHDNARKWTLTLGKTRDTQVAVPDSNKSTLVFISAMQGVDDLRRSHKVASRALSKAGHPTETASGRSWNHTIRVRHRHRIPKTGPKKLKSGTSNTIETSQTSNALSGEVSELGRQTLMKDKNVHNKKVRYSIIIFSHGREKLVEHVLRRQVPGVHPAFNIGASRQDVGHNNGPDPTANRRDANIRGWGSNDMLSKQRTSGRKQHENVALKNKMYTPLGVGLRR